MKRVEEIPALPKVVLRLNEMLQDGRSSVREVGLVLKQDPALCGKVLKLANSSYYAIPGGVSDVERALSFLGFHTIAQLVLGVSVYAAFPHGDEADFSVSEFWRFSLGVAIGSEILAKRAKHSRPPEAFTAGLLHGIGKLALKKLEPMMFREIAKAAILNGTTFLAEEQKRGLPGYAVLGHALAERWGIPQALKESIRTHVDPVTAAMGLPDFTKQAMIACTRFGIGKSGDGAKTIKGTLEGAEALEKELREGMEKAGAMLNAYR